MRMPLNVSLYFTSYNGTYKNELRQKLFAVYQKTFTLHLKGLEAKGCFCSVLKKFWANR